MHKLCFSRETVEEVEKLVRFHMFNFDPAEHGSGTVRRLLYRVGEELEAWLKFKIQVKLGFLV